MKKTLIFLLLSLLISLNQNTKAQNKSVKDSLDSFFWINKVENQQAFISKETPLEEKKEYLDKAFLYSKKALQLDSVNTYKDLVYSQLSNIAMLYVLVGVEYFNKGEYKQALDAFEKNIEILGSHFLNQVNPMVYLNAAVTAEQLKDYDKALSLYQQKMRITPTDAAAYMGLLHMYKKKNNDEEYLLLVKKGASLFPNKRLAFYGELLNYNMEKSKWDNALYYANTILAIDTINDKVYYLRAYIYQEKNNLKKANENYKKALFYNPDNIDALYNLSTNLYNECVDILSQKKQSSVQKKDLNNKLIYLESNLEKLQNKIKDDIQIDKMLKNVRLQLVQKNK